MEISIYSYSSVTSHFSSQSQSKLFLLFKFRWKQKFLFWYRNRTHTHSHIFFQCSPLNMNANGFFEHGYLNILYCCLVLYEYFWVKLWFFFMIIQYVSRKGDGGILCFTNADRKHLPFLHWCTLNLTSDTHFKITKFCSSLDPLI